jgi:hypothetical protein
LNSAVVHPAAAWTALSPVVLYAVPATNKVDGGHERLPADGQMTARWRT